jgi:hypothetical protein
MNDEQPKGVEALMKLAFEGSGRTYRSYEYRDGVRAVLEFRYNARPPALPDSPGTARCDAFLAGTEEGWALLSWCEHSPLVPPLVQHAWIEEERARLMEGLSSALRRERSPASFVRDLYVVDSVTAQLPRRPPRYSWEYARQTPSSSSESGHSAGPAPGPGSGAEVPGADGTSSETASGREEARSKFRRSEET